jgi:hypothetical protein
MAPIEWERSKDDDIQYLILVGSKLSFISFGGLLNELYE